MVKDVIVDEFSKEIGAKPLEGSALDLRISESAKNYARVARKIFREKKGIYARATAQHFFKKVTHIRIREKKRPRPASPNSTQNPSSGSNPNPAGDAPMPGPSQPPTSSKKPFNRLGRTQKSQRVKEVKAAASGDLDLLMATAAISHVTFGLKGHFGH